LKYFEVFDSLVTTDRLKKIFASAEVDKLEESTSGHCIHVHVSLPGFVKTDDKYLMEEQLFKQIFVKCNLNVKLHIHSLMPENTEFSEIWDKYGGYLLDEIDHSSKVLGSIYRNSHVKLQDNKISINMTDSFVNHNNENRIYHIIHDYLEETFAVKPEITFSYREIKNDDEDAIDKYHRSMDSYMAALGSSSAEELEEDYKNADSGFMNIPEGLDPELEPNEAKSAGGSDAAPAKSGNAEAPKPAAAKKPAEETKGGSSDAKSAGKSDGGRFDRSKFTRRKIVPDDPDVFYGSNVEGELTPIGEIMDDMGEVVVAGMVLKVLDPVTTKKGSIIFKFYITDFTNTISCKIFLTADEDKEEIPKKIKENAFLRIKALALRDEYEKSKETTLQSVRGIKPWTDFRVKRKDDAEVKRLELHAHTQMSDMDGVIPAEKLVKRAFEWGWRGVAITDHGVVQSFPLANHALDPKKYSDPAEQKRAKDFKIIYGCEAYLIDDEPDSVTNRKGHIFKKEEGGSYNIEDLKKMPYYHVILLCKNDTGRQNLYRLVSESHLKYFGGAPGRPKIPKSVVNQYREGLIIGSACEAGELYRAIVHNKPNEEIARIAKFYDYYEIQQIGNNAYMIESEEFPEIQNENDLMRINKRIVDLADADGKLCIATCDVHFMDPQDEIYRRIIMASKGFKDADKQAPLYMHTTKEMLDECRYLGDEKAYEVVVTNPNKVFDMCDRISPVRPDKAPPVIEDSDKTLREICESKAHQIYGPELPEPVSKRLEHELESIIKNGFAVMYIIAQKLVWKSNEDGYLVGSRGSVGSSFVANMAGITEINALPPHYYCPKCHYSDFDSDTCKEYAAKSGCDMPDRDCPVCGERLVKEGHNIPFETFLGFYGDKEPDIDLNFSGEYQSKAHDYTEVIFGAGQTFRAGTIGSLADKTAFGLVSKYAEEHGTVMRDAEKERIAAGCVGVRRTTGQHPGGIVVLPLGESIYSFTPIQHPANDMTTPTVTTHFEYHSIDHNLLKLDILGHDDPTMIRMLEDLTGVDAKTIPMDDEKVISLFASCDALGVKPEQIDGVELGSLGLPELGTNFVMQMLKDTKPQCFSDMVKIAGLSHGTDVWLNNAQYFIQRGDCTLSTAICTRDDIMIYLIAKGLEPGLAFKTMESVRKGKGLKPEMEEAMNANNVPEWYIESCKRIKYMFPKAHACAYMMMAFRIAYFKIYYPLAYYAAYFSIRAADFNYEKMCQGEEHLKKCMADLRNKPEKLSAKEQGEYDDMRSVLEFYARGLEFAPIDIYKATARHFLIVDGKLMPCLNSIAGLGDKAAEQIYDAASKYKFVSREDFKSRCKIGDTICEMMYNLGILSNLPKSDQMSFEDFFNLA